jgi:hypothetical protein
MAKSKAPVKCAPKRTQKKPGPKTVPVKAHVRSTKQSLPKCR